MVAQQATDLATLPHNIPMEENNSASRVRSSGLQLAQQCGSSVRVGTRKTEWHNEVLLSLLRVHLLA